MPDRSIAPPIKDAVEFDLVLKPYEKSVLDNGITVYAINAGPEEVLQVEWVFYAGNWFEEKNLVAATANYLLKNGTKHKNAFAINEHFEYYGAYLNRACYNETAVISLSCLNKYLPQLLPVVQEMITEAIFPAEEIQLYKQNNKQRLEVSLKKSDFVAGRLIDEYLFGFEHPYGKYSTAQAYDALERQEILEFYHRHYLEGNCIIFISGKLPANSIEQLNKNFGQLPLNRQKLAMPGRAAMPAAERKYRVINDELGVQGAIRMARPFPNRHHPDFTKAMVLNNLFGGFFGSRLMANIREDKGYTYGIYSYLQNHIHQSAWVISTEAGRDVCEATIAEVYHEMEALRSELVDEEELLLVKNYMMGIILGDLEGPFQMMSRWKNIILNGLGDQFFQDYIHVIKTVSAEELKELADKYLQPAAFYELVVI